MTDVDRYVRSNGARLWTCASGKGTPFLMFNGGPGSDDYLAPVARMVEDICRVIRFEPRGCGRSDWDGNYAVQTMIDDAEAVRRAYGVEGCIVGGHSFGPSLALAYALRYPDHVIGLVGIAGGTLVNDRTWSEAYHRNLDTVGEDLGGVVFTADENVNQEGNRSWRDYIKRPALFREIADLPIPATFINGSEDIRPSWPTRQLAALMPNGRYIEIAGAALIVWLTHAAALRTAVREAVARIREAQ
ncbi:MAG: alpha/beta fold hydrolase [Gammaproteobacteria bacterium]|nr:alpha/beta fold hydrolase [Gammaproteobacteria bacterium]